MLFSGFVQMLIYSIDLGLIHITNDRCNTQRTCSAKMNNHQLVATTGANTYSVEMEWNEMKGKATAAAKIFYFNLNWNQFPRSISIDSNQYVAHA